MDEFFDHYQILVEQLNLPTRKFPENLVVCHVSGQIEYQKVLNLFLKIFPDEIDSEKAVELREQPIVTLESNFIAKIGQEIIGFLISGIVNQVGYISYLGVIERYRGLGVATALLEQLKSYLQKQKVEKIRCTIRRDNNKTLGYVHYLGFKLL